MMHSPLTKISGAVLMVLLAACVAVGPNYQPPESNVPARWSETTEKVSVAEHPDLSTWWTLFGDPVLTSLVSRAVSSNQDIRIAATRIREARAQRRMVAADRFPTINSSASYARSETGENALLGQIGQNLSQSIQGLNQIEGSQNLYQVGFDAGWELDIFGGRRRAVEEADAAVAATEEDGRDVLVSLVAEVSRNYLELRGAQQRLVVATENSALQEKTLDMFRKRFQLGFGNELAVRQAEAQLAMTVAQIPVLEAAAQQSVNQLSLLLGQPPGSLAVELTGKGAIPAAPAQIPAGLPSDLLRQRPDIRRAERQLAAATADVGVATAELFPHFSLSAFLGFESPNLSDLVSRGSRLWSAGPAVKWNVFDAGRARAGVEASDSRRERAQIVYEKTVLSALVEAENAMVAFSREQQTRKNLQDSVAAAKRAVEISEKQYALGLIDFVTVLQAEMALSQSQDQLVQSEQRLSQNMVAVYKALGGGWPEEGHREAESRKPETEPPPAQR
jgi:multidrug efflux system outer membrane protein